MKTMKKIGALAIALAIVVVMALTAFADPSTPSITIHSTTTSGVTQTETTVYTWYRIFEAEIEEDPSGSPEQSGGKVAYYVDSQKKATAIEGTGLFNVVRVGETDKWYVELKEEKSAQDIVDAFSAFTAEQFALFPTGTFEQTEPGGDATSGDVAPGYYYIESTLGDVIVLQTLTAVTIETKNSYPGIDKTIPEVDKSAQIGKKVTYTIPVTIPMSANDIIVVTDEMTEGLTFDAITSVQADGSDVDYTSEPTTLSGEAVTSNGNKFTLTFDADTVIANKGKTITIIYTAVLNEKAIVDEEDSTDDDDEGNDNKVKLNYGQHYESIPHYVETDTQQFSFDKVDSSNSGTKLPGAVFELQLDGTALSLVPVTGTSSSGASADVYRIAVDGESGTTTEITTTGNLVTIKGVDGDLTYTLVETKAPTGYNLPASPTWDVEPAKDNTLLITIPNSKGSVLPSTGGMGTTILYIAGAILVLGAGILLVTKRRMGN